MYLLGVKGVLTTCWRADSDWLLDVSGSPSMSLNVGGHSSWLPEPALPGA